MHSLRGNNQRSWNFGHNRPSGSKMEGGGLGRVLQSWGYQVYCTNTMCVCVCSTHYRRQKVENMPSIQSCARTSVNLSKERQRNPRWKWMSLMRTTWHSLHRLLLRTSTVDQQCWAILGADVDLASADETPMKITNTMAVESSVHKTYSSTVQQRALLTSPRTL